MSAYLDRNKMGPDYTGAGISDPRFVNRLLTIAPLEPLSDETVAAAKERLAAYAVGLTPETSATLHDMIFGTADTAKEAA